MDLHPNVCKLPHLNKIKLEEKADLPPVKEIEEQETTVGNMFV